MTGKIFKARLGLKVKLFNLEIIQIFLLKRFIIFEIFLYWRCVGKILVPYYFLLKY